MKNINCLYLFSLLVILLFYFFPGDIVSYFMQRSFDTNYNSTQNPIAHSIHFLINTGGHPINHALAFSYITAGGLLTYFKKKIFTQAYFFLYFYLFFWN
jgi:hypothetical protein